MKTITQQTAPTWASFCDTDQIGPLATITVDTVTQRLRWIEPGRFLMGSPPDEPGRFGKEYGSINEGPQHEVRISKGFWLFNAPVTQALWTAIMGDNPSHFKDKPKHPVEQVTWNDTSRFIKKINARIPGLDLTLPTEAQWEYACRAGTAAPNYAGGTGNLPDIAWFSSNSNSQTQPVATQRCNAWGLYDMLGNVWEWCADGIREYGDEPATDPVGPLKGAERALRGGSWLSHARSVRAASRGADDRDYRSSRCGFRCARVQADAELGRAERETATEKSKNADESRLATNKNKQ